MSVDPTDLEHADEIAAGMKQRCIERIHASDHAIIGVVFSTSDVLYLVDAYQQLRGITEASHS